MNDAECVAKEQGYQNGRSNGHVNGENASVHYGDNSFGVASEQQRHTCDDVANRVLAACRKKDEGAAVVYVGRNDDGQTIVRVRAGDTVSIGALQSGMQHLFPFARVRTSESVLDGTLFAEIVVPTAEDEWRFACSDAKNRTVVRLLKIAAFALFVSSLVLYVQDLRVI